MQALSLVHKYRLPDPLRSLLPSQISVSKILVGQVIVPVLLAGLFFPPVPVALLAAALVLSTDLALVPALAVRPAVRPEAEAVAVPMFVLVAEPVPALGQVLAPATVPQLSSPSTSPSFSPPPYEPPLVPSARRWSPPLHASRPRVYPPHR